MNFSDKSAGGGIEIVSYEPDLRYEFWEINRQWIEKHFELEPIDERVLKNPETEILDRGGAIYFARDRDSGAVLGVCALMKHGEQWELTKMGVIPSAQGRGVGQKLAEAVIDHARRLGLSRLILETNSKLKPAIALYLKLGFRQVESEAKSDYVRADVKMELDLKTENGQMEQPTRPT